MTINESVKNDTVLMTDRQTTTLKSWACYLFNVQSTNKPSRESVPVFQWQWNLRAKERFVCGFSYALDEIQILKQEIPTAPQQTRVSSSSAKNQKMITGCFR